MKTIHDIMDKSDKALDSFFSLCEQMSNAKFILAEKTISELLQLIAGSKILYDIINECTISYNFSKELMRACREENGSNWVEFSHMTPKERIAFTFCLLYSFDTHKIDLQTFIHKHYVAENVNLEFALFAQTVIMQFKADIEAAWNGTERGIIYKNAIDSKGKAASTDEVLTLDEVPDYFVEFAKSKELEPYKPEVNYRINDNLNADKAGVSGGGEFCTREQYDYLLNALRLVHEKLGELGDRLTSEAMNECAIMIKSLERVLIYGNLKLIKPAVIGLKNTLKSLIGHAKAFSAVIEYLEAF